MGDGWLNLGRWVAKLWEMGGTVARRVAKVGAHLLGTAALWFESRHMSKIQNGRHTHEQ